MEDSPPIDNDLLYVPTPDAPPVERTPRAELWELICFHECGHAVVALALGVGIHYVSIEQERIGWVRFACCGFGPQIYSSTPHDAAMIDAAGFVATERRQHGGSDFVGRELDKLPTPPLAVAAAAREGMTLNEANAGISDGEKLEAAGFGTWEQRLPTLQDAAVIFRDRWPVVAALASELQTRGTLEADDVERIIRDCGHADLLDRVRAVEVAA